MMKLFSLGCLSGLTVAAAATVAIADDLETHTGRVVRVWEDGFRLETSSRRLRVDSWDVCGDRTERHIATDDRITVTGEFEGREFDAFEIEDEDGNPLCE